MAIKWIQVEIDITWTFLDVPGLRLHRILLSTFSYGIMIVFTWHITDDRSYSITIAFTSHITEYLFIRHYDCVYIAYYWVPFHTDVTDYRSYGITIAFTLHVNEYRLYSNTIAFTIYANYWIPFILPYDCLYLLPTTVHVARCLYLLYIAYYWLLLHFANTMVSYMT